VGGKEVEVVSEMSKEDYLAEKLSLGTAGKPTLKEVDESCKVNIKFNAKPTEQDVDTEASGFDIPEPGNESTNRKDD
jgi:hypothetical protein